jgi:hypothetical protein
MVHLLEKAVGAGSRIKIAYTHAAAPAAAGFCYFPLD